MSHRPRFTDRAWYWRQSREYRRDHEQCCIAGTLVCPVCNEAWSGDGHDRCVCYDRDPEAWREAESQRFLRLQEAGLL